MIHNENPPGVEFSFSFHCRNPLPGAHEVDFLPGDCKKNQLSGEVCALIWAASNR